MNQIEASSEELGVVKRDLVKLLAVNIVILAALLAAYFINRQNGFLEDWFLKIVNFF